MKLENVREAYQYHTGKASEISRQLALAALAIVWIFKTDQKGGGITVPVELLWPSFAAVGALASDLLHYIYGSIAWGRFNRIKEVQMKGREAEDFGGAPRWINWPSNTFFYLKLALVVVCYVLLLAYLLSVLGR